MDCKQIQKSIGAFDKDQLSIKEKEIFIDHILGCKECQEELEIYYIVEYGLAEDGADLDYGLDEYKKLIESYDFRGLVDKKLNDSKLSIVKYKKKQRHIKFAILTLIFCILVAGGLYIYTII
ncbi:zf-HC2 domain-containing protein [[Clostridium] fimetarium]|uniref:Zinc-finger n=1 Tax=[Clostridium] fimetarium TaxID=99656 RepID=A0A1I0RIW8_9FIRM|nr:zf-HC2 domain-containing protein [[Clostridium] fimetarium]SEW40911.1 hypothetical protein SAMN05421659_11671 [[Clostridium] fimetarium]